MEKIKYLIITAFLGTISCTNNSEDDLTNPIVLGNTRYSENVKPIIDNNCISCHGATPSNGAPMSLVTYAQVKEAVQNRGLLDRISAFTLLSTFKIVNKLKNTSAKPINAMSL